MERSSWYWGGGAVYHTWYDRAMAGMHHIMGDQVVHEYGMYREATVALQILLEMKWELSASDAEKRREWRWHSWLALCYWDMPEH
jgi:hypothetical protein